ncbi:hypothetical protein OSB04_un001384 [Centaurea solstitialis]|uniref:Reverse transcriptase domain-containing protein n=1 Tax=Centaurea solstitialis TaxID=347529 RepID=A0AA38S3C0_9ASTR|nr:hypothetical protein OSB04_un001384 [Centaurea solstitialis]
MDACTASMCDKKWGRPGFAKVLVDVWAVGELKKELEVIIPHLHDDGRDKVKIEVEYFWEPVQCSHCCVFGHKRSSCVKAVVASKAQGKRPKVVDDEGFVRVEKKQWRRKEAKPNDISVCGDASSSGTKDCDQNDVFNENDCSVKVGEEDVVEEVISVQDRVESTILDDAVQVGQLSEESDPRLVTTLPVTHPEVTKPVEPQPAAVKEGNIADKMTDEEPPRVATVIRSYQADPKPLKSILKNSSRVNSLDAGDKRKLKVGEGTTILGSDGHRKQLGSKSSKEVWNIRGLNSRIKQKEVRDSIKLHGISLFAIVETRLQIDNIAKVCVDTFGSWDWITNSSFCDRGTRIVIAWDPKTLDVMSIEGHAQFMHCLIKLKNDPQPFYVSVVYGANDLTLRRQLWSGIRKQKVLIGSQAWIIMGDFNAMLFPHDGYGGSSRRDRSMEEFALCADDVEIMDIRYSGIQYTWRQKPMSDDGVIRKLDRILSNLDFISRFGNSFVHFHPWGVSDHALGVVSFSEDLTVTKKGFKFDNFLATHQLFLPTVKDIWQQPAFGSFMHCVLCRLKKLKSPLRRLRSSYGDLSKQVATLKVELDEIQMACDRDPANLNLMEDLAHFQLAYQQACIDEEKYFAQRAKVRWLNEGDSNTRFFHNAVKERRGRNFIRSVSDIHGNFTKEDVFVAHFHSVLGTTDALVQPELDSILFHTKLTLAESLHIIRPVQDLEIKEAMFSIGNDKAPGSDGFSAKFFKAAWDVVGSDVTIAIHNFFYTARLAKELNHTLLCLIPKVPNATCVTDYRPISCCTILYKCISKVVTDRLRPFLEKLVSKAQSAFIPGRRISDNILLAYELITGYHQDRGPPRCAFKIDIRKAYDMVSWRYILHLLQQFGFHPVFIRWIEEMLQTPSYSLAINGGSFGFFKGARGIRQGDPISPYLFTLIMEGFSLILNKCIQEEPEFKYHDKCDELKITHLCFADDLFVFTHGDVASVRVIKRALDLFRSVSGLEASMDKSEVFFGNVTGPIRDQIHQLLPFKLGTFPFRYLGVPLSPTRLKSNDYGVLIRKVNGIIDNWKNKFLSFGGRKQLLVSVLQSLSVYWMSVFVLPAGVIHELEAIFRRFLWAQGDDIRGKCRLAWVDVCKPVESGGLGFKRMALWNRSLVSKHLWDILNHRNSLWVDWLWSNRFAGSIWDTRSRMEWPWVLRNILDLRDQFRPYFFSKIRNGRHTFAWSDKWLVEGSLCHLISFRSFHAAGLTRDSSVLDLVTACDGQWPSSWIQAIPSLQLKPLPTLTDGDDSVCWMENSSKMADFSVQVVWKTLEGDLPLVPWAHAVWFKGCIPKHSFCLWVAFHGRLPTQDRIALWKHEPPDMLCVFCRLVPDSHAHLFFQCRFSNQVWRRVKHQVEFYGFPETWEEIRAGISQHRRVRKMEHNLALAASVYHIWRERNMRIFQNKSRPTEKVVDAICDAILRRMAWKTLNSRTASNV